MARRVSPRVLRRRLVGLLDPGRCVGGEAEARSLEWRAGFTAGVLAAREVVRKG